MRRSPPLRFLVVVLGGWVALRTVIIAPPWSTPAADAAAVIGSGEAGAAPRRSPEVAPPPPFPPRASKAPGRDDRPAAIHATPDPAPLARLHPRLALTLPAAAMARPGREVLKRPMAAPASPPRFAAAAEALPARAQASRWSLSAWSFVRRGDVAPLAAGGLLGGSQAGARLLYRVKGDPERPLALSLRLSAPLRDRAGAEAAFGLDWRPSRRAPVHLLVERRQALGGEGRSAFGLTLYGGVDDARLGRFRIDAYAQAGFVGLRSRDPFADGSVRLSLPVGRGGRLGAGAWGAAQPGAARLDLGPQAALRLPMAGRAVTVAADWRLRVAGDAKPGSGPTLTLATDF